jgi:hypothetical protein
LIDRDPLALGEFRAGHSHRVLRDFYLGHLVLTMNHHALASPRVDDLNLDLMVEMMVDPNQDVMGGQKSQRNPVAMIPDAKKDDRLMVYRKMDDHLMIHQMMDGQNYLVDLNFRDALPCAYSLISINI